ncbi:alpha/beta fold hydrolase [Winogradskya humida]|uniref:Esterase n=1 Tax=Winogradskya humida TaxID=113566 RepID=A0ABQ3ZZ73_9ACTN|nr:alpha/beta fold hydrolase [Actinoplanes humidus]GIE23869.1 esterase [Actinoplanes humidus]
MTAETLILVGGLWLDAPAWNDVVTELASKDRHAVPVALPVKPADTLGDQVAAVLAAVDAAPGRSVVVGHSAACSLAWLAADARPDRVAKVALIGGFPAADGAKYADFFEVEDGLMPFPGWTPFEGPDAADLDGPARQAFEAAAVTVPEGVARGVVHLGDERRYDVPVALICPEFTPDQAREWIAGGDIPELARVKNLDLIDIDSGHWPMLTQPLALARILAAL